MVFQGWGLLIARAVLTVQDVGDRQWQYALGGFFQGTVEDLVHFVLRHQSRSGHAQQPEEGDAERQADTECFLQTGSNGHVFPGDSPFP